jgi:hypothetical protein
MVVVQKSGKRSLAAIKSFGILEFTDFIERELKDYKISPIAQRIMSSGRICNFPNEYNLSTSFFSFIGNLLLTAAGTGAEGFIKECVDIHREHMYGMAQTYGVTEADRLFYALAKDCEIVSKFSKKEFIDSHYTPKYLDLFKKRAEEFQHDYPLILRFLDISERHAPTYTFKKESQTKFWPDYIKMCDEIKSIRVSQAQVAAALSVQPVLEDEDDKQVVLQP